MKKFKPKAVYYESKAKEYELGKKLLEQYENENIPMYVIENHNNIEEMRSKSNKEFPQMKQNLIIGIRKTHKFVPNNKISDFLVPYTSSGCTAMCMYCYLVCNYNKCAYLRLFVNREEMLDKIIKEANKREKELVFEIGSNSDLVLENTITGNLVWTIERFAKNQKGYLTFPTKFDMIDDLIRLEHRGRNDRYYYGNLLIELMGCEQLFKVIPLSGIPTYKEFDEVDENTREFSEMLYAYKKGTESWFKKFFDAFSFYIASDDEKAKADGILSMLYVVGHEGKIKYYRDDRLAMLCRMLYRQLGILL